MKVNAETGLNRKFIVTRTYAEDGRIPEVEALTERELLAQPIDEALKHLIEYPDFEKLQIVWCTKCLTIQRAD